MRFVADHEHSASLETIKVHLRWLDSHLDGTELAGIDRTLIDKIAAIKRSEHIMVRTKDGLKVKPSTVNRVLEAGVRAECGPRLGMDRSRAEGGDVGRADEAHTLDHAGAGEAAGGGALPGHLAEMTLFSLETGLRRTNVTGLQWSQVDLSRKMAWIHPDEAKARKEIHVPLSDVAIDVLRRQRFAKRTPEFVDSVFVFRGRPVHQTGTRA